jgi:hypothetical protein
MKHMSDPKNAGNFVVLHHPDSEKRDLMCGLIESWNSATVVTTDSPDIPASILTEHKNVIALIYKTPDTPLENYDIQQFIDAVPGDYDLNIIDLEAYIHNELGKRDLLTDEESKARYQQKNQKSAQSNTDLNMEILDFCCY